MGHYLRLAEAGQAEQIWRITDDEAVRLGIDNARYGPGSHFLRSGQESIWEAMARQSPWFEGGARPFARLDLGPKRYHPRIARPISCSRQRYMRSPAADGAPSVVALSVGQATALMRRLDLICQTVHPEGGNLAAYGHETRNLLILAATEVEAHWRGVLVANGATRDRFTTEHYVRLLEPMRLAEYAIGFTSFPWLEPVRPFAGWDRARPSASLTWYAAYNAVKHDREGSFDAARLEYAISAVAACVALLVAQFTPSQGLGGRSDLGTYFRLMEVPLWEPNEIYCDLPGDGSDWLPVQHPDLRTIA